VNELPRSERKTQNRVIALFRDELGYRYLDDWTDREGNSNIEEGLLTTYLAENGYTTAQISRALYLLKTEADNHSRNLYGNNQAVYKLLRYGVPVKIEAAKVTETVHLINWREPEKNNFAIAEEVTLKGNHERRPDLVLYVNGIAVGVIELKNSRVSIGDGIRQSLSNQLPEFNAWFFSTVQFIFAGNDSEGLQYGTIGTQEKYFLKWKEDEGSADRADARLHPLRRWGEETATGPPVLRYQGRAGLCTPTQGRHHLAYARKREEHRHGAAGQVDSGEQPSCPRGHRHRPRRTGQADRTCLYRCWRADHTHQQRA
jgi:hypothetical protein